MSNISELTSIVIISRKVDEYVRVCLAKIREFYPDISVVLVVDEASGKPLKHVKEIVSKSNNLSSKRNLGIKEASSEFVAFIDSDAYPVKDWIESGLSVFREYKSVGVVGGPNLEYRELGLNQKIQSCVYKSWLINGEPGVDVGEKEVGHISSSNMMVKKKDYEALGGMNTELNTGEDIELCVKYRKGGYKIIYSSSMKVCHKQRELKGFIKQRFVWGRGVYNVLRFTYPEYLISLVPVLGLLIFLLLLLTNLRLFLFALIIYSLIVLVETIRVSINLSSIPKVFLYVFIAPYALGAGTLYAIVFGDIDNDYSMYDNREQ